MKFEKLGTNYAKFTFTITPSEFSHGLDHAFDEVKADVEVKGFRKGTVPRNIYESKFGIESLYEKALNHTIGHLYEQVFQEKSVVFLFYLYFVYHQNLVFVTYRVKKHIF